MCTGIILHDPSLLIVFILAVTLIYMVYLYAHKISTWQTEQDINTQHGCLAIENQIPSKWPLGLDILKEQYDALRSQQLMVAQSRYFDELGPNIRLYLLGAEGILTHDPTTIESILSTRFKDWDLGSRSAGLHGFLGNGIFTQDAQLWKQSRELLRRQFARVQFHDVTAFEKHAQHLVRRLSSESSSTIDLQPHLFTFTLSTTTELIFGESSDTLSAPSQETFSTHFDYAASVSATKLRLGNFHWLYNPKGFTKSCAAVKNYADYFVKRALDSLDRNGEHVAIAEYPFILDLYRQLCDQVLVRDQLVNVLLAGRDTTACLLSWTFYLLVRHPTALTRLQREISMIVSDITIPMTRKTLAKMKYLKCVLNETLRLYPQLPMNVRVASRTTVLPAGGGPSGNSPVLVRKGTGVGYSVYHMHRMESIYGADAHEFRPERWEDTNLEKKAGWGFLPFHGGPRICLGKDYALMEASYTIVRIILAFPGLRIPAHIKTQKVGQEKQNVALVISSADGCKVRLD